MKIDSWRSGFSAGNLTRQRVKRYIVQRFYTRFHMSLILASSGFAAMLGNWALLHAAGITKMWIRYPIAVSLSYLTFLLGVWLWLKYVGLWQGTRGSESLVDGVDVPDISSGGGGGTGGDGALPEGLGKGGGQFGGGGASSAWSEASPAKGLADSASSSASSAGGGSSGSSFSLGDFGDLDGDGIMLLLLALALIATIFLCSGYVIWFAPDILSEAAFGATLAGGLARTAKRHDSEGWVAGVLKKTWWPFAIVLGMAQAVAVFAAINFPGASTLRGAISMAFE